MDKKEEELTNAWRKLMPHSPDYYVEDEHILELFEDIENLENQVKLLREFANTLDMKKVNEAVERTKNKMAHEN